MNNIARQIVRGLLFSLFPVLVVVDWWLWRAIEFYGSCLTPMRALVMCVDEGPAPSSMYIYFFVVLFLFVGNIFLVYKMKSK